MTKKLICFCFNYLFKMNKLRKLIQETIEEAILSESAVNISEVLKNPHIGLITTKINDVFQLNLYDFHKDRILGTTECAHVAENIFEQTAVAAEKGYGPIMYELSMMTIYDNGLTLTRNGDIRDSAFNVWKKFYNRSDIGKFPIRLGIGAYSGEYNPHEYGEDAIIGNTAFTMAPTREFNELNERTPLLMKAKSKDSEDIKKRGGDYFAYKYADS